MLFINDLRTDLEAYPLICAQSFEIHTLQYWDISIDVIENNHIFLPLIIPIQSAGILFHIAFK